jgi:hypothetical protein
LLRQINNNPQSSSLIEELTTINARFELYDIRYIHALHTINQYTTAAPELTSFSRINNLSNEQLTFDPKKKNIKYNQPPKSKLLSPPTNNST